MAIVRMSNFFAESANKLPKEAKVKLTKVFMLLTDNPRHPSLQLKKIEGAARKNVYECRIDQFWRLILQDTGEMIFDLLYVGAHDEAISHGAQVIEGRAGVVASRINTQVLKESDLYYSPYTPNRVRVNSYLAGHDQGIEFVAVSQADLEKLVN